jgi:NAD(P)-dependent dehydrogenase (short-subunit alcohol dehydrogenase family)
MNNSLPSFDLTGKVALVTGAARGIGHACAVALAHAGADIALGLRDKNSGGELAEEIENLGRKVLPLQMDVLNLDEINAAVNKAVSHFGHLDILVNNVGVAPESPAESVTEENFDYTLNANLKGTFFVTQAVAKVMIGQKSGRIINISSQAGFIALQDESIYCMTKAAINHLTKCLAVEWAKHNINVNAVAPTFIHTPGTQPYLADKKNLESTLSKIPLGRIGEPSEVSGAVVFLASPAASLITGEVMLIDGGWTAQ